MSIERFAKYVIDTPDEISDPHWVQQAFLLRGVIFDEFCYRYDYDILDVAMENICKVFNLPEYKSIHLHKAMDVPEDKLYLDDSTWALLKGRYKNDIELIEELL